MIVPMKINFDAVPMALGECTSRYLVKPFCEFMLKVENFVLLMFWKENTFELRGITFPISVLSDQCHYQYIFCSFTAKESTGADYRSLGKLVWRVLQRTFADPEDGANLRWRHHAVLPDIRRTGRVNTVCGGTTYRIIAKYVCNWVVKNVQIISCTFEINKKIRKLIKFSVVYQWISLQIILCTFQINRELRKWNNISVMYQWISLQTFYLWFHLIFN